MNKTNKTNTRLEKAINTYRLVYTKPDYTIDQDVIKYSEYKVIKEFFDSSTYEDYVIRFDENNNITYITLSTKDEFEGQEQIHLKDYKAEFNINTLEINLLCIHTDRLLKLILI